MQRVLQILIDKSIFVDEPEDFACFFLICDIWDRIGNIVKDITQFLRFQIEVSSPELNGKLKRIKFKH